MYTHLGSSTHHHEFLHNWRAISFPRGPSIVLITVSYVSCITQIKLQNMDILGHISVLRIVQDQQGYVKAVFGVRRSLQQGGAHTKGEEVSPILSCLNI